MIFETIPYLVLFVIGLYNEQNNNKSSNNLFYFAIFCFSALRMNVGFDYMGYAETIQTGSDFEVERFEYAERKLLQLSRLLFPQVFFIINSLGSVYLIKLASEKFSSNLAVSAMAFYCFPNMFLYSMGVIRFWTAVALVVYASTYLKEKKYFKFLIFQIFALLCHNGAIIGLLFIPLYLKKIPYWINILILLFSFFGGEFILGQIISGFLPENAYSDQLIRYAGMGEGESGMSKIPYLFLGLDVFILICNRHIIKQNPRFYQMLTIYNIGVSLMFLFSFQTTLSIRLSLPFLVYSIFLVSYIVSNKKSSLLNYRSKLFIFNITSLAILVYTITIVNQTLGRSQYLPYRLFFL